MFKMRHGILISGWLFAGCAAGFGQVAEPPTFEVASVKPAAPPASGRGPGFTFMRGGPGTNDPGQITFTNVPMKFLLTYAYDVKGFQVLGPAWLDSERFDVVAKVPKGATKEQVRMMMQSLLTERFHLALHHESKEMRLEELLVGKNGPKLKESSDDPNVVTPPQGPPGPPGPPKMDANGFPQLERPGLIIMLRPGANGTLTAHLTARAQSMSGLVGILANEMKHPVVDKTGLKGNYDFNLEYAPEGMPAGMMPPPPPGQGPGPGPGGGGGNATPAGAAEASEPAPILAGALQQQLGLRLESKKGPVDVLVIDGGDKIPTEN
jgi:uncharacterized protein (TIGR03435 family)